MKYNGDTDMDIYEKGPVSLHLSDLNLLEECTSKLQDVQIFQHCQLGKVLVINNEIHNVEKWAPIYHEAITHIPMMFIEQPKSVLILGGGDLYAAKILLEYPSVEQIVICDHDPNVIRLTQKYYAHADHVVNDSRIRFIYNDAKQYLNNCSEKFDLIIDDCFNLVETFDETDNIFEVLHGLLTEDIGICCSLLYRHIFEQHTMQLTKERLLKKQKTVLSLVAVPEYPGVLHLLTIWGKSKNLSQNLKTSKNLWHKKCLEEDIQCGILFSPQYCQFYLYLPPYIRKLL